MRRGRVVSVKMVKRNLRGWRVRLDVLRQGLGVAAGLTAEDAIFF
jgi:hypothetical protein